MDPVPRPLAQRPWRAIGEGLTNRNAQSQSPSRLKLGPKAQSLKLKLKLKPRAQPLKSSRRRSRRRSRGTLLNAQHPTPNTQHQHPIPTAYPYCVSAYPALSDLSADEILLIADEHDDYAFAAMLENQPEMRIEHGFYEFLTGRMNPFANMLFGLNVPDTSSRVQKITNWLKERNAPSFWWVGPLTQPSNLDELLANAGWQEGGPAPAMIIDLSTLEDKHGPDGLTLERVETPEQLDLWQRTFSKGFELQEEVGRLVTPGKSAEISFYTALLDGQPVGTTALFIHRNVPGIYCVSTIREFRGRGIGAAITSKPLIEARDRGYKTGTLQASSMGYPVYKRLGFQDVCSLRVFTLNM